MAQTILVQVVMMVITTVCCVVNALFMFLVFIILTLPMRKLRLRVET